MAEDIIHWLWIHSPILILMAGLFGYVKKQLRRPVELPRYAWTFVFPTDKKSPRIMGISEKTHIIVYPEYSTPYLHTLDLKCKFVEVLEGTIYDEVSGKQFKPGDKMRIKPGERYIPYTLNSEACLKVIIDECAKA